MTRDSRLQTPDSRLPIMLIAGEASGDKHGAALAQSLTRLYPKVQFEFFGAGGDEMRAAGVETLVDAREVAIIGVLEIAGALGKFYRAYRRLLAAARRRQPAVVVLIDWPDFNMRVAKRLRRDGFKVVYYISPQIWAWRRYRINAIRRDVDRMLVILPFEEDFYRQHGVEVEYIGHPLANAVRATASRQEFCQSHNLDVARPLLALLPGSRHKELHYHLPPLLDAARRLQEEEFVVADTAIQYPKPKIQNPAPSRPQFILPLASTVKRGEIEPQIAASGVAVRLIERDTYNALCHADFAVVASGTATVETALADTPMVIIYRASQLNWRLIRPLIHLDTFGMVNLIAGKRIVPELMQQEVTGERIAATVREILSDPQRLTQMRAELAIVRDKLQAAGGSGAERAARAVMQVISEVRSQESGVWSL